MNRALRAASIIAAGFLVSDCATEGAGTVDVGVGVGYYDSWYDPWYGGGCCVDYPGDIGPPPGDRPHVEHPIVKPSEPKTTPSARTTQMPSPRPAAGGGGFGGGRGGGGRR